MSGVVLVTGATGYVGGRLLPRLVARGVPVRAMARRPEHLASRADPCIEVVRGDVLDAPSLADRARRRRAAYYLVHSMGESGAFAETDRTGAANFAAAAKAAGVRRIVYLGGLARDDESLSPHLASRHEVGRILRDSGVETLEFRASIVIGSGSLSFEMIRALVERLPVMTMPRWVRGARPADRDRGPRRVPRRRARPCRRGKPRVRDRRRRPGLLQRHHARVRAAARAQAADHPGARPDAGALEPVARPRHAALRAGGPQTHRQRPPRDRRPRPRGGRGLPDPARGVREAIARALRHEDRDFAETRWSDALSSRGPLPSLGGVRFGARLVDSRSVKVAVPPAVAFRPIRRIGGRTGWYYADWLWRLRGFVDLLAGGAGLRRGRRDPDRLVVGDAVDFWRVEAVEHGRLLRLFAEMKVPGRAWLAVRGRAGRRGLADPPDRGVRPRRAGRPRLLVWHLPAPRPGLPQHAPGRRPRRGPPLLTGAVAGARGSRAPTLRPRIPTIAPVRRPARRAHASSSAPSRRMGSRRSGVRNPLAPTNSPTLQSPLRTRVPSRRGSWTTRIRTR